MIINPVYDLEALFEQLGLPSEQQAIDDFIQTHRMERSVKLHEAECWNVGQRSFLKEAFEEDAMWTVAMDELNVSLHG